MRSRNQRACKKAVDKAREDEKMKRIFFHIAMKVTVILMTFFNLLKHETLRLIILHLKEKSHQI